MKIVYRAQNSIEAALLVQRLEQASIGCYATNQNSQSAFGAMPLVGEVLVFADEQQFDEARAIALDMEAERQSVDQDVEDELDAVAADDAPQVGVQSSVNLMPKSKWQTVSWVLVILLGMAVALSVGSTAGAWLRYLLGS